MTWVVPSALAGIALCAVLAITTSIVDTTYLTSGFTSIFTLAVGLSREFCRRTIMSINMDHVLKDRARAFAAEQLHILHREVKTPLIPYISVCRRIVTDVVEKYPLLHLAEEYLASSTGLPADFNPHTGTLFLLLATNVCTAIICLSIGATILAPLRIIWRSTKPRPNPWAKPKPTWEKVLEALAPALANLAAAGFKGLVFCATGLIFCVGNIIMYAANLDFGLLMKRSAPQDEPRRVFYKTLPDPRVPELEENARKLENELQEKDKNFQAYYKESAATIHNLYGQNEVLEKANMAQKLKLAEQMKLHGLIDFKRPMYEQLMEKDEKLKEKDQRFDALQEDYNCAVKEKIEMQDDFLKQLSDKCEDIKSLKYSVRAQKEEHAALLSSQEYHQDRARRGDEVSRVQIGFQKGRIQELEKLMASQKETLEARIKELLELIASNEATIKSLEAQLKERDEANNTQKEAKQALEASIKEDDARHSSEQKSQKAHLMKGFERERKKLADLSRLSSEARKAAEEKYKAADAARKVADEAREAAEQARKTAEEDSAANLEARKAAEDAYKAAEEKLDAAEKALKAAEDARKAAEEESAANLKALQAAEESLKVSEKARKAAEEESASLREKLDNRPPSHDKGTQASSPPPSPQKTPPAAPAKAPARPLGKSSCPPVGERPKLLAVSVRNRVGTKKQFNFSGPNTPNIPGTNPAAPSLVPKNPPAMPTALVPIGPGPTGPPTTPSAPAPEAPQAATSNPEPVTPPTGSSTPEPTTPPAAPSTPEPTNISAAPEPTTPEAAPPAPAPSTPEPENPSAAPSAPEPTNTPTRPSTPEPTNPPAGPSTPEPTTPEAAPSTPERTSLPASPSTPDPTTPPAASPVPEPAPAEGSPTKSPGSSGESKQPEAVNSTPAEGSPVKPVSPSGEAPEAPEPASA